jgi:hypothetical protein
MEKQECCKESKGATRQINVEAPSPRPKTQDLAFMFRREGFSTHTLSVKMPPMIGPSTDDTPNTMPNIEVYTGRLRMGMRGSKIITPPQKMPAAPMPAIARPIMKAVELGAAPQRADPTSKVIIEVRKTHFVE